jgi:6-phosphogluconolactonase
LVDERVTNVNSEDSNEHLVRNHLLQAMAAKAKFKGLVLPGNDIQKMLDNANLWATQIDIAILGMGEDGHTASIFPECPEFELAINKNLAPAYIQTNPMSAKYRRISLNLSGLIKIKHLILSASGNTKRKVLQEAVKGDNQNYPISYLLQQRPDMNIFLS